MADKERPVASFAPSIRSIKLYPSGRIEYQGNSGSIIGATARVDSSGSKRRFSDTRRVVLRIDGPRVAIAASLPVNALQQQRKAQEFAARVNEMAMELANATGRRESSPRDKATPVPAPPPPTRPPPTPDLLEQLERLGRLRDSGVLTEDEFLEQKARLLGPRRGP